MGGRASACLAPGERCVGGTVTSLPSLAQAPHPGVGAGTSHLRVLLGRLRCSVPVLPVPAGSRHQSGSSCACSGVKTGRSRVHRWELLCSVRCSVCVWGGVAGERAAGTAPPQGSPVFGEESKALPMELFPQTRLLEAGGGPCHDAFQRWDAWKAKRQQTQPYGLLHVPHKLPLALS